MSSVIEVSGEVESYIEVFNELKKSKFRSDPSWLKELRSEAIKEFSKIGFPSPKDEDWRFTNLAPIIRSSFHVADKPCEVSITNLNSISSLFINDLNQIRLVFVDGSFIPQLSFLEKISDGVAIKPIRQAIEENEDIVADNIGKFAEIKGQTFTALNTAFFEDGLFIYIPRLKMLDTPIYAVYVSTREKPKYMTNLRNLIVAEESTQLTVIEHYVSLSDEIHFSNIVTEISSGCNSNVEHYKLEMEGLKSFNISTLRVQQQRDSSIRSHSVLLGGSLVRNNIHPVLEGEGCYSFINGLYMASDKQHLDNFMKVEHVGPHCDSRQFYNGVLDGSSKGVFHGRIVVHENAAKTDAKQTNRNLLLSNRAQIDTKPQLEIYNQDVKCTHGATIGQLDRDAIFYMQSRGISKQNAENIMLKAFANQSISSMKVDSLKKYLEQKVENWFLCRNKF